jgi:hypothetical protein
VATTTPDDSQKEQGKNEARRMPWAEQWSGADKRLFLITFLGGLAANVGLVVVVALAVLTARGLAWYFRHANGLANNVIFYGVVAILTGVVSVPWVFKSLRRYRAVSLAIGLLPLAIYLLGLLGYLAGIK